MINVLLFVGRQENAEARQKAAELIHGASPAEFHFHAVFLEIRHLPPIRSGKGSMLTAPGFQGQISAFSVASQA